MYVVIVFIYFLIKGKLIEIENTKQEIDDLEAGGSQTRETTFSRTQ